MKRTVVSVAVVLCCAGTVLAGPTFTRKDGNPGKARPSHGGGAQDAFPFSDNFDSYAPGSNLAGQGGWVKWEPASVEAVVSNAQSSSPSNSMKINPLTDVTQRGNITSGTWELKAMTYYPSTNVGPGPNDGGFIIGLNQMDPVNPNAQPPGYWSGQIQWHPGTLTVRNYDNSVESTPIVPNSWVPFRMVIDLSTDRWDAYYNGIQIVTQRAWSTGVAPSGGIVAIACFDFFSGNAVGTVPFEFYVDTVTFSQVTGACYANCDGSTGNPALTANDFQCFIDKYAANNAYANCDGSTGNPALTANDFQCFINKYAGGCT